MKIVFLYDSDMAKYNKHFETKATLPQFRGGLRLAASSWELFSGHPIPHHFCCL